MSHGVHHRKLGLEVERGLDPGTQGASMLSGGLTTVPTTCLPSGKFHMYIKEINNDPPPHTCYPVSISCFVLGRFILTTILDNFDAYVRSHIRLHVLQC